MGRAEARLSEEMLDSVLLCFGFALGGAGLASVLRPLRFIGIRTRGLAWAVAAAGFFFVALATHLVDSFFVYFGFALILVGLVSLVRPLRFLYIRTRRRAALVTALGAMVGALALFWPPGSKERVPPTTRLDDWMPQWQLNQQHTIRVGASPGKVFAAIRTVRADEIFLFRTLIAIRRCGQEGPESILNPSDQVPLLDVATRTSFVLLAEEPVREIVIGTVVAAPAGTRIAGGLTPELFRKTLPAGVALATMNFLVTPDGCGGATLSTETRIYANAPDTLRRFAVYWRVIHPGSDIIRRSWLRAIKRRAEEKPPRSTTP